MNKEKPPTKPTVDRESVRVLAIELGAREAARKTGLNENTILSWSRRYGWNLSKRAGRPAINPAIELQSKPGDVLLDEHKRLEGQTRTGLSRAAAKASQHASTLKGEKLWENPAKLKDLGAAAAKLFGWDTEKPGVQLNQLVITTEQLQQIRALREQADAQGDE